jgi:hypothetical protein
MLLFTRDAFKTGRMYIKVTVDGVESVWVLKPSDKNTVIDFGELSSAVLAKYTAFFSVPV